MKMKNGAEVRTLDELKENFDLESVLGYFADGKLQTWLADRYYDDKANAVSALTKDMPDLNAKLCGILDVEYQAEEDYTDLKYIQWHNEKLRILSSVTDDREILDNVDLVAMSQEDLFSILDKNPEKVYLYGESFSIPFGTKNICYVGINEPLVLLDKNKLFNDYEQTGITFQNVKYEDNIDLYLINGESLFLDGKYNEAFPLIKQSAENGNPRAMYIMALYYSYGFNTVQIDLNNRNSWVEIGFNCNDPISTFGYTIWCLNSKRNEYVRIFPKIIDNIQNMADSGDVIAQCILGYMYRNERGLGEEDLCFSESDIIFRYAAEFGLSVTLQENFNGNEVEIDEEEVEEVKLDCGKAVEWFKKAAEQGYIIAQRELGLMYKKGCGVNQNVTEAVNWYKKAAEQGDVVAQNALGMMYRYYNSGVEQDSYKAFELFKKAANQGYAVAQNNIGEMIFFGNCMEPDYSTAVEWYKKAAVQGNETAIDNLRTLGINI